MYIGSLTIDSEPSRARTPVSEIAPQYAVVKLVDLQGRVYGL